MLRSTTLNALWRRARHPINPPSHHHDTTVRVWKHTTFVVATEYGGEHGGSGCEYGSMYSHECKVYLSGQGTKGWGWRRRSTEYASEHYSEGGGGGVTR